MDEVKFLHNLNQHQAQQASWLRKSAVPAIAAGLLAALLYAVSLGGTYVYDDVQIVRDDPRVHHVDQWIRLWKSDYFDGGIDNLYRPIVSTSYAIEWWLHGDRPWIFHLVNILMHAMAAASVAEFTRRVLRNTSIGQIASLSGGLLFAAHPVHVEVVANIVGRAELFCTTCIFIALILLCHRPLTLGRVMAVLAISIVALLSKEQGILQPLLWLLFGIIIWRSIKFPQLVPAEHTTIPAQRDPAARERNALKVMVLMTTWTWATYLILREHFLKFEWDRTYVDPIMQPLIRSHGLDRVLMPVVLLGHYTALLLWPIHLSPDYGGNVIGTVAHISDPYLWIGFLAITLWVGSASLCLNIFLPQRRRDAEKTTQSTSSLRLCDSAVQKSAEAGTLLFCLLSLAITYGLIGNILTLLATNFAERLIYLPSTFFLITVGILMAYIPCKPRVILLTALLTVSSIRTVTAATEWNHPIILFQNSLANHPDSVQLRLLLAQQYHDTGDMNSANIELRELCRRYPDYWRAWMFRAIYDMDTNDLTDADTSLKLAIHLKADPILIGVAERLAHLHAATHPTTKP